MPVTVTQRVDHPVAGDVVVGPPDRWPLGHYKILTCERHETIKTWRGRCIDPEGQTVGWTHYDHSKFVEVLSRGPEFNEWGEICP